jgi:hypothetical protein
MRIILGFFALFISLFGCSKGEGSSANTYYFKANVNGQPLEWKFRADKKSEYEAACPTLGGSLPFYDCRQGQLSYQGREGTSIAKRQEGIIDTNSIEVSFVQSYDLPFSKEEVRSKFTNGSKNFGLLRLKCSDPVVNGIVIIYIDAKGNVWNSSFGDQSGNTFEQVSLTANKGNGYNAKNWLVRFSGKLYDKFGNSIPVSDGEIYGPVFLP